MEKERIFKIPTDAPFWCSNYIGAMETLDMKDEMKDTKQRDDFKKKREPPKWPDKTPNPCLGKNHYFDPKEDLKNAPKIIEEQVLEVIRREVYNYYNKIKTVKADFMKNTVKDEHFENASVGYWNIRFMPIMVTDISESVKKALDKRGHFNLALFFADYLRLSLQQLVMDESILANPMLPQLEEILTLHLRLTCILRQSMVQLKLDEGYFDYSNGLKQFRYREIASRIATDLRSGITLRSVYNFSLFVYNMLYRFRLDKT